MGRLGCDFLSLVEIHVPALGFGLYRSAICASKRFFGFIFILFLLDLDCFYQQ